MKKTILPALLLWLLALSSPAMAERERELFLLELPLIPGAEVRAHRPGGSQISLGKVLQIPQKSKYPGYTASAWAKPGSVAATAVNAIHLSIAVEKERGRIMSLLPAETVAPAAGAGSTLVVDCPAGRALFGAWAPPVGSPVKVRSASGEERSLADGPFPQEGETLWIQVTEKPGPYMVDIENRLGGKVTAYLSPRGRRVIARVAHPLGGSGRFEGSLFQRGSALRANHCGVICVSSSPEGEIGGFQIIPFQHSHSKEMAHSWNMTQWMILEPVDGDAMVGQPPLFSDYLVPGPANGEKLWDLWSTYGRRSLVLCRIDGGPWQKLPSVSGRDDGAFSNISHLRIYYPTTREPLTGRQ